MNKIDPIPDKNGCINWVAAKAHGYGRVLFCGRVEGAHRLTLSWKEGRWLQPHEFACHSCDNPACVNPEHLFVGSPKDNTMDILVKGRPCGRPPSVPSWKAEVARAYVAAGATYKSLEPMLGFSHATIQRVVVGLSHTV